MKAISRLAFALGVSVLMSGTVHAEDKTFKIWWYEDAASAAGITWKKALETFQQKHPDVKVQFELKTFDQITKSGTMILNSAEAPDLMEYNKGNAVAGLAASQGLLTDLGDVAKQRGWDKVLSDASNQLSRYDEKGIYGNGPLIGVANYGEFVSVFYNENMFKEAGVEVPKTLEDMEKVMDVFVKKGITPIAEAANDYPAQHLMYLFALSKADAKWVNDFQAIRAPLDSAPFVYAGQKLQEWVKKGYISKDSTGLKAPDMANLFETGKSPMVVTGTWYGAQFGAIKNFKASQFLFPGNVISPASTGNIWVVPKNAKNKDLAYDFIDITLSKDNQALFGNSGGLPIAADPAMVTDPVGKIEVELFNKLVAQNGLGFYPDWPVPGYYDVMLKATQAVIGGSVTPEEFAERLKEPYDEVQGDQ
ncbi:extracellular solute-binding protein [Rhizobium sp. BG4]|jgi:raffinose/stachyose/melibiose transport system substrate-binding protein|uniref:ABC transporter substrate-binding protein n=1 Tax=Rhizobium sp. BG4 TaxID=2613770 RepID=UPI00193CA964|nr:extracellular solute-binding protein [Rhizobium sp. BG4]QRM46379.1 extracellular solute-binding protein [Rhizobium sp. BG4]